MTDALQVKGLKKSYGNNSVLKGIDFSVRRGEIFALLGVNGAGKTTALECIEGLRAYDNGEITIHGKITEDMAGTIFDPDTNNPQRGRK